MGKVEFHWVRPEVNKWRHTFNIKWEGIPDYGQRAEHQLDTIINAVGSTLLLDFTYRNRATDDDGDSNPYNQFVKVIAVQILANTGEDWDGTAKITVEEV